jgi:hypothetical protein
MRKALFLIFVASIALLAGVTPAHAEILFDPVIQVGSANSTTSSSFNVVMAKPVINGTTVTSFVVSVSSDQRTTWTDREVEVSTSGPAVTFQFTGLQPASARFVRVAYKYNAQQSSWSNEVLGTTKGTRAQRVMVQTYSGAPITGGAVSWTAKNGSVQSSVQYGLTSGGYIDFPALPAGSAQVTLVGGVLADGTKVSGTFSAFLGFDPTVLSTPNPPLSVRTVQVNLPNGVPISNALVEVDETYLSSTKTLNGFNFSIPDTAALAVSPDYYDDDWIDPWDDYSGDVTSTGYTDSLGRFTVVGFTSTVPQISVTYDDGEITQTAFGQLSNYNTTVTLDYEPYVDVLYNTVLGGNGDTVVVPIDLSLGADSQFIIGESSNRAESERTAAVRVSLLRPNGASVGRCGASGETSVVPGQNGEIRVCATKSGIYRISAGSGVMSTGYVTIHVKKAAPMVPTMVKVLSNSSGKASISWSAPEFNGNAKVSYTVTAKKGNRTLATKQVAGTSVTFSGLPHATKVKFIVKAVNKYGSSDSVAVAATVV